VLFFDSQTSLTLWGGQSGRKTGNYCFRGTKETDGKIYRKKMKYEKKKFIVITLILRR